MSLQCTGLGRSAWGPAFDGTSIWVANSGSNTVFLKFDLSALAALLASGLEISMCIVFVGTGAKNRSRTGQPRPSAEFEASVSRT